MSIADRLGRLLFIVPYAARRDGVPLSELAAKLGVKPRQIEADLELLAMVGRPPLTPDHLIDVYVEDEVVYVDLDQRLSRPPRLTHEEARALVLGAKLVGRQGGLGERLESVVKRIVEHLNPVDAEILRSLSERVGLWQDAEAEQRRTPDMHRAIEQRREIEVDYYSASADRQKHYRLQPLALITHSGTEYLVALDVGADYQEKLFRLDRVGELHVTDVDFEPPQSLDLERFRRHRLYFGPQPADVEVYFSAAVAGRVRERFGEHDVVDTPDGGIRVQMGSASPGFIARWVLPFGTEAEVLSPPLVRAHLHELCARAADAYAQPVPPELASS